MSSKTAYKSKLQAFKEMLSDTEGVFKCAFNNYHLARRKHIVSRASDHFGHNKHDPAPLLNIDLLDIGCGENFLAEELSFRGANVTAVDLSPEILEKAKHHADKNGAMVNFFEGDPNELVREGKQFEIIICMGVFDRITNIDKYCWYISKLLNPGGILILSTKHKSLKAWIWHILIAQNLFKMGTSKNL